MLRWTLLVSAMIFTQQSTASWGASPLSREISYASAQQEESVGYDGDGNADFEMDMSAATDISQIIDKKYGTKCENFAEDGQVKKWGLIIEKEYDKDRHEALFAGPADVRRACPKYNIMNDEDKKGLWILIISAMTHYESTCFSTKTNQGPNGTAAGLLQLHRGHEASYSSGCRNGDADNAERSIICGMSMLNLQIENRGALFSSKSYWDVLRPRGESRAAARIQSVIGQYPACKTGKSTDGTVELNIQPDRTGRTRQKPKSANKGKQASTKSSAKKKARVASSQKN